ncbi:PRC-barrel domain-containing protein [Actibacterium sp. 188UL27-1]|uniref:PRC-barrel domain-containing protein n=1 Tax=Actibacterium sp. 188UL27-1 TaxID=2786961 RepID=UPI00195A7666|nr:PRC-barrel domain-containing protein [Actibacterium sp. 188UL27-1]MBM7070068.1 PRC-barrel domain-containing protein [Actibacterium sp. 188UL27-1]
MSLSLRTQNTRFMTGLLASAATALVMATSAQADGHTAAFMDLEFDKTQNLNASELIGARVYASEADISNEPLAADGEKEWDDIGEINEIVLSRSGDITSVIVGVGGFLGLGEKSVAVDLSELTFVSDGEDADEYFIVVKASAAGVKDAPEYMVNSDAMAHSDRQMLAAPAIERDGYETMEAEQLTSENLTGARVYGSNDEDIGEIDSLLLTASGEIDRAVIGVGGFLGLGEKDIAVTMEELTIMQKDGDVRVYIDSTEEALEAQPAYEG